jgi:hypothetical protein
MATAEEATVWRSQTLPSKDGGDPSLAAAFGELDAALQEFREQQQPTEVAADGGGGGGKGGEGGGANGEKDEDPTTVFLQRCEQALDGLIGRFAELATKTDASQRTPEQAAALQSLRYWVEVYDSRADLNMARVAAYTRAQDHYCTGGGDAGSDDSGASLAYWRGLHGASPMKVVVVVVVAYM